MKPGHSSLKSIQMESLGRKSTAEPIWPDKIYPLQDMLVNSMLTQVSVKSLFHYSKITTEALINISFYKHNIYL